MDSKMLILQHAIQLNYLKQSTLTEFLRKNSYQKMPDNILDMLINEGLLTRGQVESIRLKITPAGPLDRDTESGDILLQSMSATHPETIDLTPGMQDNEVPIDLDESFKTGKTVDLT